MNPITIKATMLCIAGSLILTASAQKMTADQQHSIERLKATLVAKIEPGMPGMPLHQWLSENTSGGGIQYEVTPCADMISKETQGAYPADSVCMTATMAGGSLVLRFIEAGRKDSDQCADCKFLSGQEGPPPASPMKRPTRLIKKLRDLCTVLNWRC